MTRCISFGMFDWKKVITFLRPLAVRQSELFQSKLLKLFESFWPNGVLFLWKLDKEFNSFKGNKVKRFVLAGPTIADLLLECLEVDVMVLSIVKALRLWHEIEQFLKIGNIKLESEKKENVNTLIDQFEKNIITFYDVGRTSFMKDKRVDDHETYYLHCLRFYIPKMSQ